MRVAVIGGKLQGVEACYLARRAGWEVMLVDKDPSPPARGLCDFFSQTDVVEQRERLPVILGEVDLVVPAVEETEVLQSLAETAGRSGIPLALDLDAYGVTSSKIRSDRLFSRLGLPMPGRWPDCGLPVVAKPAESSGSRGVVRISDEESLSLFLKNHRSELDRWVIQEYLEGPSYSLEVIGLEGRCVALQVTALEMDSTYDCKRVLAPVDLPAALDEEFRKTAGVLARALRLNGIMDVEVVLHEGRLKLLEIDARLPSQTPAVVEQSTGANMLAFLQEVFLCSRLPEFSLTAAPRGVIYEHVRVWEGRLEVSGEHIMTTAGPLHMESDFFGADLALTNFSSLDRPWVATLIVTGGDLQKAWQRRRRVIHTIMEACNLAGYQDPGMAVSDPSGGGPE
ncbi:MAG: 3-methylornithine--L-lysine ligase PylC [Deltaproteobacteria bacterium]|nr:3-methylornithine--L-lysine ligase PylC [Deltaproteobacteria bacterium]